MSPGTNGKKPPVPQSNGGQPQDPVAPRICGAKAKSTGKPCTRPAGWSTEHPGEGRCKFHGGVVGRQLKHGRSVKQVSDPMRYSQLGNPRIRTLIAEFAADPDPLNVLPELATMRALAQDYIERVEKGEKGEPGGTDYSVGVARSLVSEITIIAKRIEDSRAANAISRGDFYRIIMEMGRVIDTRVEDEEVRRQIHDDWLGITLA